LTGDLQISAGRGYDEFFDPATRFAANNATGALFPLDGNPDAAIPVGCQATIGPMQSLANSGGTWVDCRQSFTFGVILT